MNFDEFCNFVVFVHNFLVFPTVALNIPLCLQELDAQHFRELAMAFVAGGFSLRVWDCEKQEPGMAVQVFSHFQYVSHSH